VWIAVAGACRVPMVKLVQVVKIANQAIAWRVYVRRVPVVMRYSMVMRPLLIVVAHHALHVSWGMLVVSKMIVVPVRIRNAQAITRILMVIAPLFVMLRFASYQTIQIPARATPIVFLASAMKLAASV